MKSRLLVKAIITIALLIPISVMAQNTIKLRLGGNSTRFLKEPQGQELNYWEVDTFIARYGPFEDFTHSGSFGGEAELMMSLSDHVWVGLEISSNNLKGENNNPGVFNFQYTDFNQLLSTDTTNGAITTHITNFPLKYKTNLLSFMGNLRIYPMAEGRIRPFLKASAGLSLISTELALKNPSIWMEDDNPNVVYGAPVLYSRGQPSSPEGLLPAFTFGGGVGVDFQITEKIALYGDYSFRMVSSDIVDGRPNFDWYEETGKTEHFSTLSNISRFSFGIVYTLWEDVAILGGGGGGGGKSSGQNSGRIHPYLPFHKLKRP